MYHAILTNRYLTTRVIPLIAVAAVALCVALVIIVVSVMTGFLDMVKNSGRALMGDVAVTYPIAGIPYYDRLIERIEALPEAAHATPIVDGFGLLKMPYPAGDRKQTREVQVWGIDARSFAEVTGADGYPSTLYWRPPTADEEASMAEDDYRLQRDEAELQGALEAGLDLATADGDENVAVLGMHVSIANERQRDGSYVPLGYGYWWMPRHKVWLTVVPIGEGGGVLRPETEELQVVNEFSSGVFLIDERRIVIPVGLAQKMFHLDQATEVDDDGEETGYVEPSRATMVLVRAADGVEPDAVRDAVAAAYESFQTELAQDASVSPRVVPPLLGEGVLALTWRQQQRQFIDPIEKERELMRVLFSIIYLVCAGLVLSIFWAIVSEKTRDIGILRSIGASRIGICAIFLRYGAVIGLVGSVLGLGIAWLVVANINTIHEWMGEPAPRWLWITTYILAGLSLLATVRQMFRPVMLPAVLWSLLTIVLAGAGVGLMLHGGTLIWDPSVYYFDTIPNDLDEVTAVTTMIGAIVFSVLGAVIPATKAADTDPVRALRYE